MRVSIALAWVITSIGAAQIAAAQNPFAGTWKLNLEKSQMTGEQLTFGPAAANSIELNGGGTHYSFRADGKTYALPSGDAAIWRQTGPASWTTEYRKLDNKLLSSDHWQLSADQKTLTLVSTGARANSDLYTDTTTYARTTGSNGLYGTWKTTSIERSSPGELTIQELGLDRLVFHVAAMMTRAEMTMDGKDAAVNGPDIPSGLRLSLTRTGPYSLQLVEKLYGAITRSSVFTLSKDNPGIMTEVAAIPGSSAITMIWEKQKDTLKVKPEAKKIAMMGAFMRP
jgi:hypothetical protein